jgi:hypothetical protein
MPFAAESDVRWPRARANTYAGSLGRGWRRQLGGCRDADCAVAGEPAEADLAGSGYGGRGSTAAFRGGS